ncbi:hypothetical protein SAMN06269250_0353 [Spirosoma fluviale]|uniref:Uncharacterized protein n=1 Tax=Spirosoma fluviale TaxID=1597977 RepID=A0A286F4R3_9BACT|nr:hypothetical protein SAMN06269250_0353 [Spirosoma fluviale]
MRLLTYDFWMTSQRLFNSLTGTPAKLLNKKSLPPLGSRDSYGSNDTLVGFYKLTSGTDSDFITNNSGRNRT